LCACEQLFEADLLPDVSKLVAYYFPEIVLQILIVWSMNGWEFLDHKAVDLRSATFYRWRMKDVD
jgi:hypothetical protein